MNYLISSRHLGESQKTVELKSNGGGYGAYERILQEEIDRQFFHIEKVAGVMSCCISTARKSLHKAKARFIIHESKHLYFSEDVIEAAKNRIEEKAKGRAA